MSTKFYAVNATTGDKDVLLLTLDSDMVWVDQLTWDPIQAEITVTSDLGRWVTEESLVSEVGRPITLESVDGMGYQTKSVATALKTLFEVINFRAYIETIDNSITVTKKIRCRHEDGGIKFKPHIEIQGLLPSTFMYGGTAPFEVVS